MREKLFEPCNSARDRGVPQFAVAPPLRCFFSRPGSRLAICGELARWMRPGEGFVASAYVCDRHKSRQDVRIPDVIMLRRVRLLVAIDLAGVSWLPAVSHSEALERLERVVADMGGLLNVCSVVSAVGEHRPPPPPGGENGG